MEVESIVLQDSVIVTSTMTSTPTILDPVGHLGVTYGGG